MSATSSRLRRRRHLALGFGVLVLAGAVACPAIRQPLLGLAPGDATFAAHLGLVALADLCFALGMRGFGLRGLALWLGILSFPLLFVPGFPAALAPIGLVPWYAAILAARDPREAALVGSLGGGSVVLGAAGWIFHYFRDPTIPAAIALGIAGSLGAVIALGARALVPRSRLWIPLAAALVPLNEVVRSEWLNPPLPGLLLAHANAHTALIRLAPWLGEVGITYLVALIGLAGGAWVLASDPGRPRALRAAALAAAGVAIAAPGPSPEEPAASGAVRVCSVQDPLRRAGAQAFGGGGEAALFALAEHAESLGCRLLAFPEYSVRLTPRQLVPADWNRERLDHGMVVIAGGAVEEERSGEAVLRNVVCGLHLGAARQINCAGALDKLVFAPFGEVGLFQDLPIAERLGAFLSLQATGAKFMRLVSVQPSGLLPIGEGRRAGVAICWEILVPGIFEKRGVPGRGSVDLLVLVSDLDGFGGSQAAIDQFRRASALHAARLGAPLLFASTNDPFLVTPAGRLARPVAADAFATVWEVAFPGR